MKYGLLIILVLVMTGCVSTPESVVYNEQTVATYSTAAGCGTLILDQDCSQMSGSTRKIELEDIKLRIAGGNGGKVIFIMSMPNFSPDEVALNKGSKAVEKYLLEKGIKTIATKVMYGAGKVFGVHYTLDGDGYSELKMLTVKPLENS